MPEDSRTRLLNKLAAIATNSCLQPANKDQNRRLHTGSARTRSARK